MDAVLRRTIEFTGGMVEPTDPFSFDPAMWVGLDAGTWNGLGVGGFDPVFIDGFEDGDMSAWSFAQP